jgi:hypothetical protein
MMLTVEERVDVTEERIDRLEAIFGQFMAQTGTALLRIDRAIERMEQGAEKDRQEWNKRWGELANKLGTIVEDIVAPNMPRIAREYFGCTEIEDFMIRRQVRNKKDRSKRREFDVIVVTDDKVVINETKSNPRIDYIDSFIAVLVEIEDYFPEYKGKTIIPVFASLYIGEDVVNYLTKHQIYAMAMRDETMTIVNFEKVSPR